MQPAPAAKKALLTYRETAEELSSSERSVYAWAKAGHIKVTRLGRLVRIHRDEVERVAREGVPTEGSPNA